MGTSTNPQYNFIFITYFYNFSNVCTFAPFIRHVVSVNLLNLFSVSEKYNFYFENSEHIEYYHRQMYNHQIYNVIMQLANYITNYRRAFLFGGQSKQRTLSYICILLNQFVQPPTVHVVMPKQLLKRKMLLNLWLVGEISSSRKFIL